MERLRFILILFFIFLVHAEKREKKDDEEECDDFCAFVIGFLADAFATHVFLPSITMMTQSDWFILQLFAQTVLIAVLFFLVLGFIFTIYDMWYNWRAKDWRKFLMISAGGMCSQTCTGKVRKS